MAKNILGLGSGDLLYYIGWHLTRKYKDIPEDEIIKVLFNEEKIPSIEGAIRRFYPLDETNFEYFPSKWIDAEYIHIKYGRSVPRMFNKGFININESENYKMNLLYLPEHHKFALRMGEQERIFDNDTNRIRRMESGLRIVTSLKVKNIKQASNPAVENYCVISSK